jgi:DNA-3-methyladenine glycosylase II
MRRIDCDADVADGLAALLARDPRLVAVAETAGAVPLRRRPGGFEGLAAIITAQQISTTAAASIWARLAATVAPFTPDNLLATPERSLRAAGLSRAKIRTMNGIAAACADGLDLTALHELPAEGAIAALRALNGVGPWTAEIYLLFCAGHPDVFPAGDLALQNGVQRALRLVSRPSEKALREIAAQWSPWRGVAARLFWAYYRASRVVPTAAEIPG